MKLLYYSIIMIYITLLSSCSFTDMYVDIDTDIYDKIPDYAITNLRQVYVRNQKKSAEITAEHMLVYQKKNEQQLENLQFFTYDNEGALDTTGSANRAVGNSKTENVEFFGDIVLQSNSQDALLKTEYFAWDSARRKLSGKPEEEVHISQSNGTNMTGKGLEVDLVRYTLRFNSDLEAQYVESNESEEVKDAVIVRIDKNI